MVGPDIARRGFVVLDVDGAGVAHTDCVTGLGMECCIVFIILFVCLCAYLAECKYDILIILAHIVHTGVMPGSNVVLRDLRSVRGVTLVVTLKNCSYTPVSLSVFLGMK